MHAMGERTSLALALQLLSLGPDQSCFSLDAQFSEEHSPTCVHEIMSSLDSVREPPFHTIFNVPPRRLALHQHAIKRMDLQHAPMMQLHAHWE